jgi:hypothetical protein
MLMLFERTVEYSMVTLKPGLIAFTENLQSAQIIHVKLEQNQAKRNIHPEAIWLPSV